MAAAYEVRCVTAPNPWVGCVDPDRRRPLFEGATSAGRSPRRGGRLRPRPATHDPGRHRLRHPRAVLPPRPHRRPAPTRSSRPGVARVVVGIEDPDPAGRRAGHRPAARRRRRRRASGCAPPKVAKRSSRPTSTTAAPAGPTSCSSWPPPSTAAPPRPTASSQWITGPEARADAHRLRAESDADPRRRRHGARRRPERSPCADAAAPRARPAAGRARPSAPPDAKVQPCLEHRGDLGELLDELGRARASCRCWSRAGPTVAGAFHRAGLVDRYVLYLAPGAVRRRRRPRRCSPARRAPPSTTCGAAASSSVEPPRRRPVASTSTDGDAPDVHRHRRGARAPSCRRDGDRAADRRHDRARRRRSSATRSR